MLHPPSTSRCAKSKATSDVKFLSRGVYGTRNEYDSGTVIGCGSVTHGIERCLVGVPSNTSGHREIQIRRHILTEGGGLGLLTWDLLDRT